MKTKITMLSLVLLGLSSCQNEPVDTTGVTTQVSDMPEITVKNADEFAKLTKANPNLAIYIHAEDVTKIPENMSEEELFKKIRLVDVGDFGAEMFSSQKKSMRTAKTDEIDILINGSVDSSPALDLGLQGSLIFPPPSGSIFTNNSTGNVSVYIPDSSTSVNSLINAANTNNPSNNLGASNTVTGALGQLNWNKNRGKFKFTYKAGKIEYAGDVPDVKGKLSFENWCKGCGSPAFVKTSVEFTIKRGGSSTAFTGFQLTKGTGDFYINYSGELVVHSGNLTFNINAKGEITEIRADATVGTILLWAKANWATKQVTEVGFTGGITKNVSVSLTAGINNNNGNPLNFGSASYTYGPFSAVITNDENGKKTGMFNFNLEY